MKKIYNKVVVCLWTVQKNPKLCHLPGKCPHTAIIEVDVLARGVAVRGDFGIEDGTVGEDSM